MFKKILFFSFALLILSIAVPAFASSAQISSAVISCVGTAVNARESAIDTGISNYTQAVQAAYSTRATALQQAYTTASSGDISLTQGRSNVKAAWSAFNTAIKTAVKTWKTTRLSAWSQFRTAVKTCKAPSSITDTTSSTLEVTGQ